MFPENIGPNMSIDETSLSNGELYTFLSNKDAHCKQGSIAAYVKGTKIKDIVEAIMRIPEDIRSKVEEVTMDLSESMRASIEACFPNACRVVDRFHVQQEVCAGLNEIRMIAKRKLDLKSGKIGVCCYSILAERSAENHENSVFTSIDYQSITNNSQTGFL